MSAFLPKHGWVAAASAAFALLGGMQDSNAADLAYLQGLLAATPAGGWVKANTNSFGSTWPTGADAAPASPGSPGNILLAWSGFAWDSTRSDIILYGGGHANYVGNEIYVWKGGTGEWTRASLPSKVDLSTFLVNGAAAPQSTHTYATNSYAPLTDRFVLFGGAGWNTGGNLFDANGRTGEWWWDPSLADPNKVGGQTGTGWNPAREGANSWQMRPYDPWSRWQPGNSGPNFINGTSVYREENGKDVFYVTTDQASGWPQLYRYELGTPTTPDVWQRVGLAFYTTMWEGSAAIDSLRGLMVRTGAVLSGRPEYDLAVWNLANNNVANPGANRDFPVTLVTPSGGDFDFDLGAGIDYDEVNDQFVIWDSNHAGAVWVTRPQFGANGAMLSTWTVYPLSSTTSAQPTTPHLRSVLGKWEYVEELDAFVTLEQTSDTAVWFYKPLLGVVPELPAPWQMLLGLLVLGGVAVRRQSSRSAT